MATPNLSVLIDAVGEGINVLYKVTHGSGIFAAFALADELSALSHVTGEALKAELSSLSPEDRKVLEDRFKAKLVLDDKALELKVEEGSDLLNTAVDVVFEAVKVANEAQALLARGKALFA